MQQSGSRFWDLYSYTYDAIRFSIPYDQHMRALLDALDLGPGLTVLDLGSATGNLERAFVGRGIAGTSFLGLDFSERMNARARSKCPGTEAVAFRQADLSEPLLLEDTSFDRVVCNNLLYAMGDQQAFLDEAFRVLIPGGLLVLSDPKPTSRIPLVIKDHFAQIARMPIRRRLLEYAKSGITLPVAGLAPIILNTLVIDRRVSAGNYRFSSEEALRELLRDFSEVQVTSVYADQSWLVEARKGR